MAKLYTFFLSFMLFFIAGTVLEAREITPYPPLTDREKASFYARLGDEITRTENRLSKMLEELKDSDRIHTVSMKLDLQNSAEVLEVKQILAEEFQGKDSIRSPLVRQRLTSLFSKSRISAADLKSLQNLVDREKVKIRQYDDAERRRKAAEESARTKADLDRQHKRDLRVN